MKNGQTAPDMANNDVLTTEDAGMIFGVSKWAMYKRAQNGMVPAHYLGRRLYFLKSELINLVSKS